MWEAFCGFIFWGMEALWSIVGDWGLAIILATLVLRLLLFPLMQSQSKSSYKMQKVQPLIQDIQERYADHPQRMQEELQKVYAETKFNPLAGCLPLILQMPIFIAMFQILRDDGGTFIKPYAEHDSWHRTRCWFRCVPSLHYPAAPLCVDHLHPHADHHS